MRRRPTLSVYAELALLRRTAAAAVRALELITEALVTEREARHATTENALSVAQTRRTEARLAWIDLLFTELIGVFPDKRDQLVAAQRACQEANAAYVETLNFADAALLNRITAMLLNEQIDREAGDATLRRRLEGERE